MNDYFHANAVSCKFGRNYMLWKKDLPIRPSRMGALNVVEKQEGAWTPLRLAEESDVSKSMLTAHINVLEKQEYVYWDYVFSDKQSFYVVPTEKARALVTVTDGILQALLPKIGTNLGKEKFALFVESLDETQNILCK